MIWLGNRFANESDGNKPVIPTADSWSPSFSVREDGYATVAGLDAAANERPICAFDGCSAHWPRIWKRRVRPVFEGGWGCSKTCVHALVETAVKRETEGAEGANVADMHQHRVPLGLVLLAQGLVTQTQLQTALAAQKSAGHGRIGEWLVEAAGIAETKITRGIGLQWQCPVLSLTGFDAPKMALAMPVVLRKLCNVAPLRVAGGRILYLAFDQQVDAAAAFALERMSGLTVESGVVPGGEFAHAVERLEKCTAVPCREFDVPDRDAMSGRIVDLLAKLQPVASKLVRLRDRYWLRLWLERGAFGKDGMLPVSGEDVVDVLLRVRR
jgi:hypothetical protein